jgi:lantibiotic modifying enzyme
MLSWCHGAPGIALARLCLNRTPLWDRDVENELHCALASAADVEPAGDSLCCGRFGRAAILRVAARHLREQRWLDAAVQLEGKGLTLKRAQGRYSFRDVPGLFQGAAGVGLALLDGSRDVDGRLLSSVLSAGLCGGPGA